MHFDVGDSFWRFSIIPDSEDEIGETEGDNMLSTFLVESSVASCIDITLGGCDLILESPSRSSLSSSISLSISEILITVLILPIFYFVVLYFYLSLHHHQIPLFFLYSELSGRDNCLR